jgi:hypothetical protein
MNAQLFGPNVMYADSSTTFQVFFCQGVVFFILVLVIDYFRTTKYKTLSPVKPGFEQPKLKPSLDILKHEESIRESQGKTDSDEDYLIKAVSIHKTYDAGLKTHAVCGNTFGIKKG